MNKHNKLVDIPLDRTLADKKEYKRRLKHAQLQLLRIQRHIYTEQKRAILLFEGWDAAGKGGSIRRLVERLDPRGYRVHPIGAPDHDELQRHYLHRFWEKLPPPGTLGIFDRSWYGRVLVERVEALCPAKRWQQSYAEINAFEAMLAADGVPIVKFFLHISQEEQLKRFKEREQDPFKAWKITPEDWRNRERWDDYESATDDMFKKTSTKACPWTGIASEHKWYGRVSVIEHTVSALSKAFKLSLELPPGWHFQAD
ncbi:MAG TPA: UDP-galactose-lipid carrier transferase [Gammaproteobacteria bacterium]|nr:UDP-galactose-lipid carrier transferase [Gammaproteobacteria bacterium]